MLTEIYSWRIKWRWVSTGTVNGLVSPVSRQATSSTSTNSSSFDLKQWQHSYATLYGVTRPQQVNNCSYKMYLRQVKQTLYDVRDNNSQRC